MKIDTTLQGAMKIALSCAVLFICSCKDTAPNEANVTGTETLNNVPPTPIIEYTLVKEYPHDPTAFTEGLEFVDGYLYESTGRNGFSDIRKADLATGKVLQQQPLDAKYFGEGMTILNGKLYQLTYKEKQGFIYDAKTFKLLKTFTTNTAEAWGMTNDGTHLIYGDGTNALYYLDPNSLQVVKTLQVSDGFGDVANINELEFIKGYIYANQWQTNFILKIDTASGKVVGQANLDNLRARTNIPQPGGDETAPEVLNGIAYDKAGNRIFITGKNWPKLFEIKLDN